MAATSTPHPGPSGKGRGRRFWDWLWERRILLLFLLLMAAMLPARSLWAPDEPDFAQTVREMRERGSWLLPYLNGQPYSEKPILFYWLLKGSAMLGEGLSHGRGFLYGIAPWALRLPSVLAASLFALGFRRWIKRFQGQAATDMSCMMLFSTPIWVWQAQTIQVDMVFAALLAWSWLAWLGGFLIAAGDLPARDPRESLRWFLEAYFALGMAVLAKGPLALVLSLLVGLAFLTWEGEWARLRLVRPALGTAILALVVLPWYLAAGIKGGPVYAYQMIIHQNFERATRAWDHVQPWWRYLQYLAGDFWPWSLLVPLLGFRMVKAGRGLTRIHRFQLLAVLVPLVFLSWVQSKQGKYLLMVYPFLALLLPPFLSSGGERFPRRWPLRLIVLGLWLPALALGALAFTSLGGASLNDKVAPFLGPIRAMAGAALVGAFAAAFQGAKGRLRSVVAIMACTLGLIYFSVALWGFPLLDDTKGYQRWTAAVQPLIKGRKVYFWQTLRSGAMVYTDHLMPEVRSLEELELRLGPEDRLVSQGREWEQNAWGMTPEARARFQVELRVRTGENELLLIRKKAAVDLAPRGEGDLRR